MQQIVGEWKMKISLDKILIASGFIGPILFFFTVYFLFPFFYQGYDIMNQTISELGGLESPVKLATNVFGFSLFGIFIMLFALGLFRSKEVNSFGRIGAFFIFVTGILMYLTGIFSNTLGFYSEMDVFHEFVSNSQFPILAIGFVIFAFSIATHIKLRWLTPVVLALGLVTLGLAYVFFFTYDLTNRGIWQRFAIGIPYMILMIIAFGLYKVQFGKNGKN